MFEQKQNAGESSDRGVRPRKLEGLRVLILEDNKDLLSLYQDLLSARYGAVVKPALSAYRARKILDQSEVDVILCDLIMPEEGGFEFIERWRATELKTGRKRTIAIAMSATKNTYYTTRARDAGFDALLAKPVTADDLADHILQIISH